MENLWIREMGGAEVALDGMSPDVRIRIMADAIEYAVFHSSSPLASFFSGDVTRLVRSAIDATRASDASSARVQELFDEMGALVNGQAPAGSIVLSAAIDLLASLTEQPTSSEVVDVLFGCYDATLQSQGFGRIIALQDQASSEACWDVIRNQKILLGIA